MASISALHVPHCNQQQPMVCLHTGAEACNDVQVSGRSAILPALPSSSPAMSVCSIADSLSLRSKLGPLPEALARVVLTHCEHVGARVSGVAKYTQGEYPMCLTFPNLFRAGSTCTEMRGYSELASSKLCELCNNYTCNMKSIF